MIDLLDLMNELFESELYPLDHQTYQIILMNHHGDHEAYTSASKEQLLILRSNLQKLYYLLVEQTV